jgi:hypothetical protein
MFLIPFQACFLSIWDLLHFQMNSLINYWKKKAVGIFVGIAMTPINFGSIAILKCVIFLTMTWLIFLII